MAGRKTKFTPEACEKIVNALRVGNTRRASALGAGISEALFYEWLKKGGKAKSGEFLEFLEAVTRAEAECEIQNVAILKKAAAGYKSRIVTTKTKSHTEIVRKADGEPLTDAEGNPKTVVVAVTETTIRESDEFDWRAALEWLKRRNPADWSESAQSEFDDEISELMALLAAQGQATATG